MGELLRFRHRAHKNEPAVQKKIAVKLNCADCDRLRSELDRSALAYCSALETLLARIEDCRAGEYESLRIAVDEARINAGAARLELAFHRQLHLKAN